MSVTLDTRYEPDQVEDRIYKAWLTDGSFRSQPEADSKPYTIVIPPPNITGELHMGHALNLTLQDMAIRFRRMQGRNALWIPGTDHAGIATQNVVERQLAEEGLNRQILGREKFIARVWKWRETYGDRILGQIKKLGSSCDWDRLRFTLDEGLSKAVRVAFVRLFDQGLIYRGNYLVNRCPRCQTALADDEVEHESLEGHLWTIKYPVAGARGRFIHVATTRPETLLGDTAVAVHPEDERYTDLVGKTVTLPLMDRPIPVIADEQVDPRFGTGAVKVTPAHDPMDFEMGRRHELPEITVIDGRGMMNAAAGEFAGLDRFEAREKVVQALTDRGLLESVEDHTHNVGHCYRCQTVIEPSLSEQWFVKMKPLATAAIEASNAGKIRFHPKRWERIYLNWLENVRDWCISRQIWWGHRIPVWYCQGCEEVIASVEDPATCPQCGGADLEQDPDVLDTWFSSALWPFSTLGWPDDTPDLEYYYPTNTLVTDRGIIYFWVARMVMMGLRLVRNIPFRDVYIHGTILDDQGRKMSKSLGNGIDPVEMIEQFGADAVRFSLIMLSSEGQDLRLSVTRFEEGRKFANKVWNAARFCLLRLEESPETGVQSPESLDAGLWTLDSGLPFEDRWILSKLTGTVRGTTASLERFRFNEAYRTVYEFIWGSFCDWYVELVKPRLGSEAPARHRRTALRVLAYVLDHVLRLLHPLMPFLTDEIWRHLGAAAPARRLFEDEAERAGESIMTSGWPSAREDLLDEDVEAEMARVQSVVVAVRRIREKRKVPHGERVSVYVSTEDEQTAVEIKRHSGLIAAMSPCQPPTCGVALSKPPNAAVEVLDGGVQVFVPVSGNVEVERRRVHKDLEKTRRELGKIEQQLQNPAFLDKAKPEIVDRQKTRRVDLFQKVTKLEKYLEELKT